MPRTLKEKRDELPQIDSFMEHDPSPEYANKVIDECLRFYTLNQIAAQAGISRRLLSYMRHRGINTYPMQLALEIVAGIKVLDMERSDTTWIENMMSHRVLSG